MNISKDRLLVFHGCDRKVGTTMVAHCVAKSLAKIKSPGRVLFVALNGSDDIHYCGRLEASIGEIKSRVDNNLISGEEIMNYCERDGELYVLGGASGVIAHRDYGVDFSSKLLTEALNVFDVIVADCGNELDCSLCIGGLTAGGRNILVINQNESSLLRYEAAEALHRALDIGFDLCVVNRYLDSDAHDTGYLRARLGKEEFECFHTLKEEKNIGRIAEMDGRTLLDYKSPGFSGDIRSLVNEILMMSENNDDFRPGRRQGRGRRSIMM